MLHFSSLPDSTLVLLRELCAHPATQPFALTGGTALALRYGHRLSVDLDFFTPASFDSQSIADELTKDFHATEVRVNPAGMNLMIRGVKVDLVRYRYELLQPFETSDGVRLFGLKDNIAMKLSAITNRGAKKDFGLLQVLSVVAIHQASAACGAALPHPGFDCQSDLLRHPARFAGVFHTVLADVVVIQAI